AGALAGRGRRPADLAADVYHTGAGRLPRAGGPGRRTGPRLVRPQPRAVPPGPVRRGHAAHDRLRPGPPPARPRPPGERTVHPRPRPPGLPPRGLLRPRLRVAAQAVPSRRPVAGRPGGFGPPPARPSAERLTPEQSSRVKNPPRRF